MGRVHRSVRTVLVAVVLLGVGVAAVRFAAGRADSVAGGIVGTDLAACASAAACVSTAGPEAASIAPLRCPVADPAAALRELVDSRGWEVVEDVETGGATYLHVVATTPLLGFHDDLELLVGRDGGVAVRSASRVGEGDLGTNRERVDALRDELTSACGG